MYNESSCRTCGEELIVMLRCKYCDETNSWICKKCNIIIQHLHSHNLEAVITTAVTKGNNLSKH